MSTQQSILRIGITGNIGSGKSTVCRLFELMDIPVYYADEQARRLMIEDQKLVSQIKDLLGEKAYQAGGQLNRAYIASIVFADKAKLAALNALVHPAVGKDGEDWHHTQSNTPYTLYEAALLYESNGASRMDLVIVVSAAEEVRIERVMKRDNVTREAVMARIKNQWPEEKKVEKADFVINNNGDQSLIKQVWDIHQSLTSQEAK